jgi:O-acetyl-ADP-ribose deacetylase (regulator of RNase III)
MCGNANPNGWWFRQAIVAGGNADGAIHKSAGKCLQQECNALPPVADDGVRLKVGMARVTSGHELIASHIIHTLGPSAYNGIQSTNELQRSYTACLEQAHKLQVRTLALPAISCGVFAFPVDIGAAAAFSALESWVASVATRKAVDQPLLNHIEFVLYDEDTFCTFADAAYSRWPQS